jgi:hypothetical protein
MDKLSQLIAEALENSPQAEEAQRQLASLGAPAVGRVFEEVKSGNAMAARRLASVVTRAHVPESVPAALELLSSTDFDHTMFALAVLASSKDPRGVAPLVAALKDAARGPVVRRVVADALGELRGGEALGPVLEIARELGGADGQRVFAQAREEYDYDKPQLLLALVRAAAKLGDHSLAPVAVFLCEREPAGDDDPEASVLRSIAAETLKFAVADGMLGALRAALRDRLTEVRQHALDALFYVGHGSTGADFLALAEDPAIGHNARVRFSELTGAPFSDTIEPLREHWARHGADYQGDTCWRLGEPIWLPKVIDVLGTDAWRQVLPELHLRTGEDFSAAEDPLQAAQSFWNAEGARYRRGGLYKFGQLLGMPAS